MTIHPATAVTGVILAGGRGARMGGRDKGLMLLGGQPLVVHIARLLGPQVADLLINANRNLAAYRALGHAVVSDGDGRFQGPLAGMSAALRGARHPYVLTVPCDSPLLPADYAQRMLAGLEDNHGELSVAHDGQRLQPVFALLGKHLESSLSDYLAAGERKIDRWFARHRRVPVDFSDRPEMFKNLNTPEELAEMEAKLAAVDY
jgi:molybdopterin-guanine dinucleotide biosynthesis protein A